MHRRRVIQGLGALPMLSFTGRPGRGAAASKAPVDRMRPGGPAWPDAALWDQLRQRVGGNLIAVQSPLDSCRAAPDGEACRALFRELKNPYFIGDNPALTQTCGWVDAWAAEASVYAVAARSASDVAATVNFARENNLRLVIKGGGHSYLGASSAADSLMIWTRALKGIAMQDAFVPRGGEGRVAPAPAVTVGAGEIWMHVYGAVTTQGGRYVQGGGCGTVGVAGLVLGGGFGSYSKAFGLAGASLLEAEVVTADGAVSVVNPLREPDLFWALQGGGGGSFGVVTRLTLRTWPLPASFGIVATRIRAASDAAYRELIGAFVAFYAANLCNPHWGELARATTGRRLEISMNFQGLDKAEATALWRPFLEWVAAKDELSATPPVIIDGPGRYRWDGAILEKLAPDAIRHDDRPNAPADNFFWAANLAEAGHVIHDFQSLWLPAALLQPERQAELADALVAASRLWDVEMHFQKGLFGAQEEVLSAARNTPMNPIVTESFMLAILASEGPPAFLGLPGHAPDVAKARRDSASITLAMAELRKVAPVGGAYVAESSYYEGDWQRSYWGSNYARLRAIKSRYDPEGLFFVRHGVGSEDWSDDGFHRLS